MGEKIEGHERLTSLAGQFINFGLIGNTVSDLIRIIEVDGGDGKLRPRTIAFLAILGTSLLCQLLYMILSVWRVLYLRNKKEEDLDDNCCTLDHNPCCTCTVGTRQTGEVLFNLCFILTTVIMTLQVVSGVVGATTPIPQECGRK